MIKRILSTIFFLFFLSGFFLLNAQGDVSWEPVKLDVAGHTSYAGVAAFCNLITCDGNDAVLIKFKNDNDYDVIVRWYDAILSKDNKWFKKDDSTPKKVIVIKAGQSVEGICNKVSLDLLKLTIKDFMSSPQNFSSFAIYRFEVEPNK